MPVQTQGNDSFLHKIKGFIFDYLVLTVGFLFIIFAISILFRIFLGEYGSSIFFYILIAICIFSLNKSRIKNSKSADCHSKNKIMRYLHCMTTKKIKQSIMILIISFTVFIVPYLLLMDYLRKNGYYGIIIGS